MLPDSVMFLIIADLLRRPEQHEQRSTFLAKSIVLCTCNYRSYKNVDKENCWMQKNGQDQVKITLLNDKEEGDTYCTKVYDDVFGNQ